MRKGGGGRGDRGRGEPDEVEGISSGVEEESAESDPSDGNGGATDD